MEDVSEFHYQNTGMNKIQAENLMLTLADFHAAHWKKCNSDEARGTFWVLSRRKPLGEVENADKIWKEILQRFPRFQNLFDGVEKIRHGDLKYKIPLLKTGDEIEKLISAFNDMVDSINKYIKDLAVAIKEKHEAEADIKIAAKIQQSLLPKSFKIPDKNSTLSDSCLCDVI